MTPQMKLIGDNLIAAIKAHVQKALAPLLETQRDLLGRLDRAAVALETAERRLSRQGDHIAKLESRLQAIEHGTKGTR